MNKFTKIMKTTTWASFVTAAVLALNPALAQPPAPEQAQAVQASPQAAAAASTNLSPAAAEVIRLAESGVSQEVIVAYVQNAQSAFELSADDVLYFKDVGVAPEVITAMLNHDSGIRANQSPQIASAPPPTVPANQAPPVVEAPLTPPTSAEITTPTYMSTPPPAEVNYFYNDLSPYGSWVVLDGVGWCWQPRTVVVARGWRPYCDGGRWVNSDCGWYWQSDYSWGWAPFHYGRWYMHERCGWVWTPDRVWGPAWVSWRVAGDACGWAPLPPHAVFDSRHGWRYNGVSVSVGFDFGLRADHFTFVAVRDFDHRDLGRYRMPAREINNVYRNTTIVNNYTVVNNTVVNRGIPVDRVTAVTHREIPRATLRDLPANGRETRVASGQRGATPVVYRHELPTPVRPAHAVAQRVDQHNPVIQHPTIPAASPTRIAREGRRPEQNNNSTVLRDNRDRNQVRPAPDRTPAQPQTVTTPDSRRLGRQTPVEQVRPTPDRNPAQPQIRSPGNVQSGRANPPATTAPVQDPRAGRQTTAPERSVPAPQQPRSSGDTYHPKGYEQSRPQSQSQAPARTYESQPSRSSSGGERQQHSPPPSSNSGGRNSGRDNNNDNSRGRRN